MGVDADAINVAFEKAQSIPLIDWNGEQIPLYWQNVDVPESPPSRYVVCDLRNTSPQKVTVEPGNKCVYRIWVLQMGVVVPDNIGLEKPAIVTDQIVEAFPVASTFGDAITLKVQDPARVAGGVKTGGRVLHPVQIRLMNIS